LAFTPGFLDEVRARIGLSDTVGRRVRLQRRGREHTGLCPFHNEKTPSFTVNDEKGFFHCFGCGAHGDVIGFVMRTENLSFPEAVERLAEQAGLEVPRASPADRERAEREQTLHTTLEAACAWFEAQLRAPAGREALAYLKRRGLTDDTIARFRLGFAPDGRGALRQALAAKSVAENLMLEAGLVRRPEGGGEVYDYFRGRVMFPITDRRGRVIAFGGRVMGDGQPKYLNSPESEIFHKGRVLYGLAQAQAAARERREIVAVEGYMDAIALSEAGWSPVVAPLGTALTEAQIELLWRLAPEPILCFDGDAAGQRAMWRAADRVLPLLKPGHSLRFVTLPAGEDPDSLVRARGLSAFTDMMGRARPLVDVVWDVEVQGGPALDTPERRADLRRRLLDRVRRIGERSVAQLYEAEMVQRLDQLFRPQRRAHDRRDRQWQGRPGMARPGQGGWRGPVTPPGPRASGNAELLLARAEQGLLAALLREPGLLAEMAEELSRYGFESASHNTLREALLAAPPLDSQGLQDHLNGLGFSELLGRLLSREVAEAAPVARSGKAYAERRAEWLAIWARIHRRAIVKEIEADKSALETDLSAGRLAQLSAKTQDAQSLEPEADVWGDDRLAGTR
jgi:DNA primase